MTLALAKYIKLPKDLQGLMPVLILPLLSTLITGLAMVFVIGPPMKWVNDTMTADEIGADVHRLKQPSPGHHIGDDGRHSAHDEMGAT